MLKEKLGVCVFFLLSLLGIVSFEKLLFVFCFYYYFLFLEVYQLIGSKGNYCQGFVSNLKWMEIVFIDISMILVERQSIGQK